jgi:hypothetical protein
MRLSCRSECPIFDPTWARPTVAVGRAQAVADVTKLKRQTVYRIRDDAAGCEAALTRGAYRRLAR